MFGARRLARGRPSQCSGTLFRESATTREIWSSRLGPAYSSGNFLGLKVVGVISNPSTFGSLAGITPANALHFKLPFDSFFSINCCAALPFR